MRMEANDNPGRAQPRRIGLFYTKDGGRQLAVRLRGWLEERGYPTRDLSSLAPATGYPGAAPAEGAGAEGVDLLLSLGGDGTLLRATRVVPPGTPVLGVNLGRVGFLAELGPEELWEALPRLLAGEYAVEERRLLEGRVLPAARGAAGEASGAPAGPQAPEPGRAAGTGPAPGRTPASPVRAPVHEPGSRAAGGGPDPAPASLWAVNELVLRSAGTARLLHVRVWVGDQLAAEIAGDGVVVATATGSTAYALAAGGPAVPPELECLVVVPLCSFSLAVRPFLVAPGRTVAVELVEGSDALLTADGQETWRCTPGQRLVAGLAPRVLRLVRRRPWPFYEVLRAKLFTRPGGGGRR